MKFRRTTVVCVVAVVNWKTFNTVVRVCRTYKNKIFNLWIIIKFTTNCNVLIWYYVNSIKTNFCTYLHIDFKIATILALCKHLNC